LSDVIGHDGLNVFFTVGDEISQEYLIDLTKTSVINDNDENSDDSTGTVPTESF
jgi:hypothetical protein